MQERLRSWWKRPSKKQWFIGAIATPVVLWILWWAWLLPDRLLQPNYGDLTDNEKATLAHQYRGTLIGGVGTIATVIGAVFLFRNFRLANKRLDLDTKKITQDAELAEDRLISERFAKAVEQLGNEHSIHIRLGGIYSLGRLAEDSDEMHQTVLDVLSAFIREKHPKARTNIEESKTTSDEKNNRHVYELSTDVKAALTVTLSRKKDTDVIDLINTAFNNMNLSGIDLSGVNLGGANLSYAYLDYTDLRRADLSSTNLGGAALSSADLSGADLFLTNLNGANLSYTNLIRTNLSHSDLRNTDLICANLSSANLSSADLSDAALGNTNLSSANLSFTCFIYVDIRNADLRYTYLSKELLFTIEDSFSPLLCNVALPSNLIEAGIDPNRDCDRLPQLLSDRYGYSLEEAQELVKEARQKTWD